MAPAGNPWDGWSGPARATRGSRTASRREYAAVVSAAAQTGVRRRPLTVSLARMTWRAAPPLTLLLLLPLLLVAAPAVARAAQPSRTSSVIAPLSAHAGPSRTSPSGVASLQAELAVSAVAPLVIAEVATANCSDPAQAGRLCGASGETRRCLRGICTECHSTADCDGQSLVCQVGAAERGPEANRCIHKPLFAPFTRQDWIGSLLAFVVCALAAGGGIGGGGVLVPVFIAFVGFSPRDAIPLSKATIFGGAIANIILNYRKRHPLADRPLIDYNASLVLEPMTLAGTLFGVYLNKVLPPSVTLLVLLLTLYIMLWRTTKKGLELWRKENAAASAAGSGAQGQGRGGARGAEEGQARSGGDAAEATSPMVSARSANDGIDGGGSSKQVGGATREELARLVAPRTESEEGAGGDAVRRGGRNGRPGGERDRDRGGGEDDEERPGAEAEIGGDGALENAATSEYDREEELRKILEQERQPPPGAILLLVISWLFIFATSLLRGGEGAHSIIGMPEDSPWQWALMSLGVGSQIVVTWLVVRRLMALHRRKVRLQYEFQRGDVEWTARNAALYPTACMAAGCVAGLVGIGGGMIKGPLMLELGMLPEVVAATAAWMILFTSSSTTMQFSVLGLLQADYAIYYALVSFVASFFGQSALTYLVTKYKKTSYIVFSIAVVIGISTAFISIDTVRGFMASAK